MGRMAKWQPAQSSQGTEASSSTAQLPATSGTRPPDSQRCLTGSSRSAGPFSASPETSGHGTNNFVDHRLLDVASSNKSMSGPGGNSIGSLEADARNLSGWRSASGHQHQQQQQQRGGGARAPRLAGHAVAPLPAHRDAAYAVAGSGNELQWRRGRDEVPGLGGAEKVWQQQQQRRGGMADRPGGMTVPQSRGSGPGRPQGGLSHPDTGAVLARAGVGAAGHAGGPDAWEQVSRGPGGGAGAARAATAAGLGAGGVRGAGGDSSGRKGVVNVEDHMAGYGGQGGAGLRGGSTREDGRQPYSRSGHAQVEGAAVEAAPRRTRGGNVALGELSRAHTGSDRRRRPAGGSSSPDASQGPVRARHNVAARSSQAADAVAVVSGVDLARRLSPSGAEPRAPAYGHQQTAAGGWEQQMRPGEDRQGGRARAGVPVQGVGAVTSASAAQSRAQSAGGPGIPGPDVGQRRVRGQTPEARLRGEEREAARPGAEQHRDTASATALRHSGRQPAQMQSGGVGVQGSANAQSAGPSGAGRARHTGEAHSASLVGSEAGVGHGGEVYPVVTHARGRDRRSRGAHQADAAHGGSTDAHWEASSGGMGRDGAGVQRQPRAEASLRGGSPDGAEPTPRGGAMQALAAQGNLIWRAGGSKSPPGVVPGQGQYGYSTTGAVPQQAGSDASGRAAARMSTAHDAAASGRLGSAQAHQPYTQGASPPGAPRQGRQPAALEGREGSSRRAAQTVARPQSSQQKLSSSPRDSSAHAIGRGPVEPRGAADWEARDLRASPDAAVAPQEGSRRGGVYRGARGSSPGHGGHVQAGAQGGPRGDYRGRHGPTGRVSDAQEAVTPDVSWWHSVTRTSGDAVEPAQSGEQAPVGASLGRRVGAASAGGVQQGGSRVVERPDRSTQPRMDSAGVRRDGDVDPKLLAASHSSSAQLARQGSPPGRSGSALHHAASSAELRGSSPSRSARQHTASSAELRGSSPSSRARRYTGPSAEPRGASPVSIARRRTGASAELRGDSPGRGAPGQQADGSHRHARTTERPTSGSDPPAGLPDRDARRQPQAHASSKLHCQAAAASAAYVSDSSQHGSGRDRSRGRLVSRSPTRTHTDGGSSHHRRGTGSRRGERRHVRAADAVRPDPSATSIEMVGGPDTLPYADARGADLAAVLMRPTSRRDRSPSGPQSGANVPPAPGSVPVLRRPHSGPAGAGPALVKVASAPARPRGVQGHAVQERTVRGGQNKRRSRSQVPASATTMPLLNAESLPRSAGLGSARSRSNTDDIVTRTNRTFYSSLLYFQMQQQEVRDVNEVDVDLDMEAHKQAQLGFANSKNARTINLVDEGAASAEGTRGTSAERLRKSGSHRRLAEGVSSRAASGAVGDEDSASRPLAKRSRSRRWRTREGSQRGGEITPAEHGAAGAPAASRAGEADAEGGRALQPGPTSTSQHAAAQRHSSLAVCVEAGVGVGAPVSVAREPPSSLASGRTRVSTERRLKHKNARAELMGQAAPAARPGSLAESSFYEKHRFPGSEVSVVSRQSRRQAGLGSRTGSASGSEAVGPGPGRLGAGGAAVLPLQAPADRLTLETQEQEVSFTEVSIESETESAISEGEEEDTVCEELAESGPSAPGSISIAGVPEPGPILCSALSNIPRSHASGSRNAGMRSQIHSPGSLTEVESPPGSEDGDGGSRHMVGREDEGLIKEQFHTDILHARGPWMPYEAAPLENLGMPWLPPSFYAWRWKYLVHTNPLNQKLRVLHGVSVGEALLCAVMIGQFMAMMLYWISTFSAAVLGCGLTGSLSAMSLMVVYFLGMHNNFLLLFVLGVPFDRTAFWHAVCGTLCIIYSFLHGVTCEVERVELRPTWEGKDHHFLVGVDLGPAMYCTGWIMQAFMFAILASVFTQNMTDGYAWFRIIHIVGGVMLTVGVLFHGWGASVMNGQMPMALPGAAFWLVDHIIRRAKLNSCVGSDEATIVLHVPGEWRGNLRTYMDPKEPNGHRVRLVEVRIPADSRRRAYTAGQWVYLNIPSIDTSWHPFTVASADTDSELKLFFPCEGRWTRQVADLVHWEAEEHLEERVKVAVEGPYGSPMIDVLGDRYKHFLIISAGVGWTMLRAWKRQLLSDARRGRPVHRVHCVALVRYKALYQLDELSCLSPEEQDNWPRTFGIKEWRHYTRAPHPESVGLVHCSSSASFDTAGGSIFGGSVEGGSVEGSSVQGDSVHSGNHFARGSTISSLPSRHGDSGGLRRGSSTDDLGNSVGPGEEVVYERGRQAHKHMKKVFRDAAKAAQSDNPKESRVAVLVCGNRGVVRGCLKKCLNPVQGVHFDVHFEVFGFNFPQLCGQDTNRCWRKAD